MNDLGKTQLLPVILSGLVSLCHEYEFVGPTIIYQPMAFDNSPIFLKLVLSLACIDLQLENDDSLRDRKHDHQIDIPPLSPDFDGSGVPFQQTLCV